MELNIMEWNINQRGRQFDKDEGRSKDGEIPLWIIEYIPEDSNIVVFTEFNCHAKNILEFYNSLALKGFRYETTNYSCTWSNDILIAVRGKEIEVKSTSYVKAYPDIPYNSFRIDWNNIPENLHIELRVADKNIHIWGIRIKELKGNYEMRKNEMNTLVKWLNETDGINIVAGDFNNLRDNTNEKSWNLKVLTQVLGDSFIRKTPTNYSWGVSQFNDGHFDGYIKNDHLIHSKELADVKVKDYSWDFLNSRDFLNKADGKQELDIPDCTPDHGILFGTINIE